MNATDTKLGVMNAISLSLTIAGVQTILSIILILCSIVYTIEKIREIRKKRKNDSK